MSTTSTSPGLAPSTAMGPERLWMRVRSTFCCQLLPSSSAIDTHLDVVRGVVVADLPARPVVALDLEHLVLLDGAVSRDVRAV